MAKQHADFQLLLKIREIRADAAARLLSVADKRLKDAERKEALAGEEVTQAGMQAEGAKLDHDPARKKYISGAELSAGAVAVTLAKAALYDASREHETTVRNLCHAQFDYQESLLNFQLKQKSLIKTEATLETVASEAD